MECVMQLVRATAPTARVVASAQLPTELGDFRLLGFEGLPDGGEHTALVRGEIGDGRDVLVRLHSECLTGDAFGSLRCDCRAQLHAAQRRLIDEGRGVLLYLRQEGRGIGLTNKVRAYALQEQGLDTVDANRALGFADDLRDYAAAAAMLGAMGVRSVRLMTNNPDKVAQLRELGVEVTERVAHQLPSNPHNARYLATKALRSGHLLRLDRSA
ncbi:MAG: GTP cyclohydrolase II [Myxococcales bacterium]|nr:GTP cyclohydrolase II [Myxococcales bacterium]